jgi:hypothetical protein
MLERFGRAASFEIVLQISLQLDELPQRLGHKIPATRHYGLSTGYLTSEFRPLCS